MPLTNLQGRSSPSHQIRTRGRKTSALGRWHIGGMVEELSVAMKWHCCALLVAPVCCTKPSALKMALPSFSSAQFSRMKTRLAAFKRAAPGRGLRLRVDAHLSGCIKASSLAVVGMPRRLGAEDCSSSKDAALTTRA